jgi:Ycf66 protein N-terminus
MINVGISSGSLIGLINILLGILYCAISVYQLVSSIKSGSSVGITARILQLIFLPLCLVLSGVILFFQGWRLDPILTFQQFLLELLIIYLILVDLKSSRNF